MREHPPLFGERVITLQGDAVLRERSLDPEWELHLSRLDGAAVVEDRVLRRSPDSLLYAGALAAASAGSLMVMWTGDGFQWAPAAGELRAPSHAERYAPLAMHTARGAKGLAVLWGRTLFIDAVGDRLVELQVSLFP